MDIATDVVKVPVSPTSTILPPVFKISDFEKCEYSTDVLNADRRAQTGPHTDLEHVEKLRRKVHESRWMSEFGSFSVAEKNALLVCFIVPPSIVDGKLAVRLYLVDECHRSAVSTALDDSGIDWASFAKVALVQR